MQVRWKAGWTRWAMFMPDYTSMGLALFPALDPFGLEG